MTAPAPAKGALDRNEAAEYLGCGTDKLREYVSEGLIVPRYHGVKPVYRVKDLDDLLETLPTEKAGA